MARMSDNEAAKKRWAEEERRLLNPDRVAAYLDEFTALSRKYGIRIENIGSSSRTVRVIREADHGKYRLINERGQTGWSLVGDGHYNEHGEGVKEVTPKLTLPLTEGQRVVLRDGSVATVASVSGGTASLTFSDGGSKLLWSGTGQRFSDLRHNDRDAVRDAKEGE